jgi:hypothetical protein
MNNISVLATPLKDLRGHKTTTIGDHDFIELSVQEWIDIDPIPTNRDSASRVHKMKKVFDPAHEDGYQTTLTEVALGVVIKDFDDIDPDTNMLIRSYKKGEWYRVDGNTRAFYWKAYPVKAKEIKKLAAKIHYLSSVRDVNAAYYPYNSQKSVEKSGEILQGLAKRYNWQARQPIFSKGGYKSALDIASTEPDMKTRSDVFEAFNQCFEGLKFLDSIPKGSGNTITDPAHPKMKSQAIIAALLVAYKIWGNNLNLYSLVDRLSNIESNEIIFVLGTKDKELDPAQIIAAEYMEYSFMRVKNPKPDDCLRDSWLGGMARSTKFDSIRPQMDFLLHWIEAYIKNPKITYKANIGVQGVWKDGKWKELISPVVEDEE